MTDSHFGGQDLGQGSAAQHSPQGGLGEQGDRLGDVLHLGDTLDGVFDLVEQDAVHSARHTVLGQDLKHPASKRMRHIRLGQRDEILWGIQIKGTTK